MILWNADQKSIQKIPGNGEFTGVRKKGDRYK